MKCTKKSIKGLFIFTTIFMLLFMTTYMTYADYGDNKGNGNNDGPPPEQKTEGWRYTSSEPDGTHYLISIPGFEDINLMLPDGYEGSGGMKGYGLGGDYGDYSTNKLPTGEIIINASDIAAVLREFGYDDAAAAIEDGSEYDMFVEQYASIYDPNEGRYVIMTMTEFMDRYNNGEITRNGIVCTCF